MEEQTDSLEKHAKYIKSVIVPLKSIYHKLYEECAQMEKLYGYKKKKGGYTHHKKLNLINKRKRKKTIDDTGADLICGDPNVYLKDQFYLSDKSADVNFADFEKCKDDLDKFNEKKEKVERERKEMQMKMQVKEEQI